MSYINFSYKIKENSKFVKNGISLSILVEMTKRKQNEINIPKDIGQQARSISRS